MSARDKLPRKVRKRAVEKEEQEETKRMLDLPPFDDNLQAVMMLACGYVAVSLVEVHPVRCKSTWKALFLDPSGIFEKYEVEMVLMRSGLVPKES